MKGNKKSFPNIVRMAHYKPTIRGLVKTCKHTPCKEAILPKRERRDVLWEGENSARLSIKIEDSIAFLPYLFFFIIITIMFLFFFPLFILRHCNLSINSERQEKKRCLKSGSSQLRES